MIKKSLLCLFVVSGFLRQASAQEVSDISTILPGSQLTFESEVVVRAGQKDVTIGDRFSPYNDENTRHFIASCDLYPEGGPVGYDRKITADRTIAITAVRQEDGPTGYTYLQLGTTGFIRCSGWHEEPITIGRFRSILSDLDIKLVLRVPEL